MASLVLLLVFLVVMVSVGVWGMRKTSTLNDFFLGGRSCGPWMSAFAYGTTYFSAVVFIEFKVLANALYEFSSAKYLLASANPK